MPNISLPTGKVIYLSVYEYYFQLEDKDVDAFFQSCVADDLGFFEENPFSSRVHQGRLEVEETPVEIEETPVVEDYE
jgi:hypothetical protein